jgi:4'-phosphopantetheinyl transferase
VAVAVERAYGGPARRDLDLLSAAERERCAAMTEHRAAEFARGRSLLRRLAGRVLGMHPAAVPLRVERSGMLRVDGSRAGVSLSHSRGHTAAAVWAGGNVGIDVEEAPAELDERLVRRCCPRWQEEILSLGRPGGAVAFARLWTAQEACVKALGTGLAGAPWNIPVRPGTTHGHWRDVTWHALELLPSTGLAIACRHGQHRSPQPIEERQ